MNRIVLITDSLFVFEEHERALEREGFLVKRLDKPKASDEELTAALSEAHGYILGGIERLTLPILRQATNLQAIAFTGSGYKEFIPAYKEATELGIAIAAAKGGNANSVAEYTLALILMALRDIAELTPPGQVKFKTTNSAEDMTIGILGLGSIGSRVAGLCVGLGFEHVLATSRNPANPIQIPGVKFVSKKELIERSDILTLHVSAGNGTGALNKADIDNLKKGAILINAAFPEAVDQEALVVRLRNQEITAAFDAPIQVDTSDIPRARLMQSNMQTAFNTKPSNQKISDWVTRAIIALLSGKSDPLLVNPEYAQYRAGIIEQK